MSNISNIIHAVEVNSFSMANTKSVETRKALYDSIERDLKAIFREAAAGFDLNEGYYLRFNKNDDGSWKTDLHVSIRQDDAYWESTLSPRNKDIENWCAIPEIEHMHDKGRIANYPCHIPAVFSIEAEVGDRWSKKTKLGVGNEYGAHYYVTNANRASMALGKDSEYCPRMNSYSSFKQVKGSQEYAYNQIKLDKAYRLFKFYVQQFFARIKEINEGYELAKAKAEPHNDYLTKVKAFDSNLKKLNKELFDKFNPNANDRQYRPDYVTMGSERIWLMDADLQSPDNIDTAAQILELISKLNFKKSK